MPAPVPPALGDLELLVLLAVLRLGEGELLATGATRHGRGKYRGGCARGKR